MLATFLFEFGAALYVLWRYKFNLLTRLVVVMLLSLGLFQLAEYMLCGGIGIASPDWARLGYVSITLLPVVGIHIIATLAGKKLPVLIYSAYTSMVLVALYFALAPGAINAHECRPNYAVFDMSHMSVLLYGIYYYGWLITGVFLSLLWSRDNKQTGVALRALCIGYVLFMFPTATVNLIAPETTAAIPSIMCGFAVILAIILVFVVMPTSRVTRRKR
ncbi:MAG: hypothetical protein WAS27_00030 [Candidatus Saccharimonadales bacterium]